MDIHKGRKWLSQNHLNEVNKLELKMQRSRVYEKTKFTKKDEATLNKYYEMIDYLGSVNG